VAAVDGRKRSRVRGVGAVLKRGRGRPWMKARATWSCREVAMPDIGSFSDVERWWRRGAVPLRERWAGPEGGFQVREKREE
jgi:hypothetical protein